MKIMKKWKEGKHRSDICSNILHYWQGQTDGPYFESSHWLKKMSGICTESIHREYTVHHFVGMLWMWLSLEYKIIKITIVIVVQCLVTHNAQLDVLEANKRSSETKIFPTVSFSQRHSGDYRLRMWRIPLVTMTSSHRWAYPPRICLISHWTCLCMWSLLWQWNLAFNWVKKYFLLFTLKTLPISFSGCPKF